MYDPGVLPGGNMGWLGQATGKQWSSGLRFAFNIYAATVLPVGAISSNGTEHCDFRCTTLALASIWLPWITS